MAHHSPDYSNNVSPRSTAFQRGKFGRLFPALPPQSSENPNIFALNALASSMMTRDINDVESSSLPAGYTYLGQFIAHDMSFDPTTIGERMTDPEYLWNFRTPALDLDSVYGGGPSITPYLYDTNGKFIVEYKGSNEGQPEDLSLFDFQRNKQGVAIIADVRNDENVLLARIHIMFQLLHNHFINEYTPRQELTKEAVFNLAKRQTVWHYQWIVLYDYLPRIIGTEQVLRILNFEQLFAHGRHYYDWRNEPFLPIEFAAAVFRFGHTQVRDIYLLGENKAGMFRPPNPTDDTIDLRQKSKFPIALDLKNFFFDLNDENVDQNFAHRIEPRLSSSLGQVQHFMVPQDSHLNQSMDFLQYLFDTIESQGYDRLSEGSIDQDLYQIWNDVLSSALKTDQQAQDLIQRIADIGQIRVNNNAPRGMYQTQMNIEFALNQFLNGISATSNNQVLQDQINDFLTKVLPNFLPRLENLAFRTLLKGVRMSLPSGQSVAALIGVNPIPIEFNGNEDLNEQFGNNTPLWYYTLREASEPANRQAYAPRLGPVGATIVGEVIVGILEGDGSSFRSQHPGWVPPLLQEIGGINAGNRSRRPIDEEEDQNLTMRSIINFLEARAALLP